MIKYNLNTINDWFFSTDNIIKVYRNNAICYYKIDSSSPSGQTPCFAVVEDISQYSDTEFEDVYDKATEKWYKLNNLNQYEEYGVYGSGRTICEGSTSRLPVGYTEVEYIENTGTSYINTDYYPNQDTRIVAEMQVVTYNSFGRLLGAGNHNTANTISCDYVDNGNTFEISWGGYTGWTQYSMTSNYNKHTYDWNKNSFYIDETLLDSKTYTAFTCSYKLGIFNVLESGNVPTSNTQRYFYGKLYSFKIYDNDTLVRDFVPAKRDSDSKYGLYDVVNDVFYISPNGNNFIGGETTHCVTTYEGKLTIDGDYEYIYSGSSWVNVGEVSGTTIDIVWIDPPSTNNQNASFTVGHYWGEGYKMIMNAYLSGSYSSDVGSFWRGNGHTPIELSFYSNGFYYDFHNPTSTSAPDVATSDYSWRIMKNGTLSSYENSQIFNVILTNGTVRVELEDGTAIVTGSTSVSTQSWYNGLYQVDLGIMNTSNKCHTSRIQVYNANDELVNDIKFVKNQGVTGSQEISAYDSVLNVTYNNTNSYTPSYHIVSESGGTKYPIYYDEIQDPPNNLVFSSMAEAEAYECPWVGMRATIDGSGYTFSGDSQSGYEWVYNPSRLPVGYTEVEYVQNTGTSYFNTNFTPNQDTRVVMQYQMVTDSGAGRFWGAGAWNSATGLEPNYEGGHLQISWLGKTSWTSFNNVAADYNKHLLDLNKNYLYLDETLVGSNTYTVKTASDPIGVFTYIGSGRPSSSSYWGLEHFKGKMYSFQIYDNGTLVRDLVPCIKDSDNTVGAYDIVNDVFYTVPTGYTTDVLVAGNPV